MYEVSDTGGILALGSVKNASFCEGKILYWFAISAPPCRVLEVYTDQSKKVCFVTWQPQ
jgi:hypothetical protein